MDVALIGNMNKFRGMKPDVSVSDLCVTTFLHDSQQQLASEPKDDFAFFPDIVGGFSSNGQVEKIDVGDDIGDFLTDQMLDHSHHDSHDSYAEIESCREAVLRIDPNSACMDMVPDGSGTNIGHIWDWESDMNSQNFDDENILDILVDHSHQLNTNAIPGLESRMHLEQDEGTATWVRQ